MKEWKTWWINWRGKANNSMKSDELIRSKSQPLNSESMKFIQFLINYTVAQISIQPALSKLNCTVTIRLLSIENGQFLFFFHKFEWIEIFNWLIRKLGIVDKIKTFVKRHRHNSFNNSSSSSHILRS